MLKRKFAALWAVLLISAGSLAAAQVSPDALFPATTQGYFSVTSIDLLKEEWQKTRIGALLKDPLMVPVSEELKKQVEANWVNRLGLAIDDLKSLPTGSVSGGLIAVPGKTPGFVLVIGVNGRNNETLDFLQRIGQKLTEQNVTKATSPVDGASKIIKTYFTFPVTEKNPKGGLAVYLVTQDMLVITDQQHLADLLAARLNGDLSSPLKDKPSYKAIMERTSQASKYNAATPLFKWYIEPLEFAAAIRTLTEEEKTVKKKAPGQVDAYELLAAHGFKEIQGAGGILDLASDNSQMAFRTLVYAPRPHKGAAIKMLSFKNSGNFAIPEWLPEDIARFTILHVDANEIFKNVGPLFDDIVDEPGVWEQVLQAFKEDKYRQQIDIQKELIDLLGERLILLTRFHKPIATDSSRFVAALELKQGKEKDVAAALEKLLSSEQDAKKTELNGLIFWQSKPSDGKTPTTPSARSRTTESRSIVPGSSRLNRPTSRATTATDAKDEKSGKIARELFFDKGALTVAHGYIFVSNNMEDLTAILDPSHKASAIDKSDDYAAQIKLLTDLDAGKKEHFMQLFAYSGDLIEPTYELIRQGKMPESQTVLGVILRAVMASPEEKQAASKQRVFDRTLLPEFEKIRQYFGTAGSVGSVEETGWLIEGVQLQ